MLKALARRRQEQGSLPKPGAQYEQGIFGPNQPSWPGPGHFNLPGTEGSFEYMDNAPNGAVSQANPRQSSPYSLPASEINFARQIMQSGSRGFDQPIRGDMQFGATSTRPDIPPVNLQHMSSSANAQQKSVGFQQHQMEQQRPDMPFLFYS